MCRQTALALLLGAAHSLPAQLSVSVSASPRSFTVVSVPVPQEFSAHASVGYQVITGPVGTVLGSQRGTILVAPGAALTLTLGVPAGAPAGRMTLARVSFHAGASTVEVPVDVIVRRNRRIALEVADSSRVVGAGATYSLPFRLTNLGNAEDTVLVRIDVPQGWHGPSVEPTRLTVAAGGTAYGSTTVNAPTQESGSALLRLVAFAADSIIAVSTIPVMVVSGGRRGPSTGPVLTTTAALAAGPWGTAASTYSLGVAGPISDGVSVSAAFSPRPRTTAGPSYAFSRHGVRTSGTSVQLRSDGWRAGLGITGETCSDLCGVNLIGRGASAAVETDSWRGTLLATRPDDGLNAADGSLDMARAEFGTSAASMSAAYSRLIERGAVTRQLDALAIGAGGLVFGGNRIAAEVARRRFDGGQGVGWGSSFSRRTNTGNIDLRYAFAPGGSRAFARATRALSLSANRNLGRVALSGNAWDVMDGGASIRHLTSGGWSLGTSIAVGDGISVSFSGRENSYAVAATDATFGGSERAVEEALDVRRGRLSLALALAEGIVSRETSVSTTTPFRERAPRALLRGAAGVDGSAGTFGVFGHAEWNGPGAGLPGHQWSYGARVDRFSIGSLGSVKAVARGEVQRFRGFAGRPLPVTLTGAGTLLFPQGGRLELSVERNPYFLAADGGNAFMWVLSVTRLLALPRLTSARTEGMIFGDLNGNGARDRDEPGLGNILVRRGTQRALTDKRGHYTFDGATREAVDVDARTVPAGWMAPGTGASVRALGLIPVADVEVSVRPSDADSTRVSAADLARVRVIARDARGRSWMARPLTGGRSVFDALPPGAYQITVDLSPSREPLFLVDELPTLVVGGGRPSPPYVIVVRARPIRFGPSPRSGAPPSDE